MRGTRLIVLALLLPVLAPAAAHAGARVDVPCSFANDSGFSPTGGTFTERRKNLVVGPLSLGFGRGHTTMDPAVINRIGGDKLPVILMAGRTATVRITKALRRTADGYEAAPVADANINVRGEKMRDVKFIACPRKRNKPRPQATFWMLWIEIHSAPSCVYLDISIDGKPARKRVMSMGAGRCPTRG